MAGQRGSPGAIYHLPCTSSSSGSLPSAGPYPLLVPTILPAIMLLASLYLVLAPILDHPQTELLYIFLFLLSRFLLYFLFVYFQCWARCLQTANLHL